MGPKMSLVMISKKQLGHLASVALDKEMEATHMVTLSLMKSRQIVDTNGLQSHCRGDDVIYGQAFDGFIRSLSKSLTLKSNWRRNRPMLHSFGSIENGACGNEPHLHIGLKKPDFVSDDAFISAIKFTALGNPWVIKSPHSVNVRVWTPYQDGNSVSKYIMKNGIDRILYIGRKQVAAI
jgi:hypothetical protein